MKNHTELNETNKPTGIVMPEELGNAINARKELLETQASTRVTINQLSSKKNAIFQNIIDAANLFISLPELSGDKFVLPDHSEDMVKLIEKIVSNVESRIENTKTREPHQFETKRNIFAAAITEIDKNELDPEKRLKNIDGFETLQTSGDEEKPYVGFELLLDMIGETKENIEKWRHLRQTYTPTSFMTLQIIATSVVTGVLNYLHDSPVKTPESAPKITAKDFEEKFVKLKEIIKTKDVETIELQKKNEVLMETKKAFEHALKNIKQQQSQFDLKQKETIQLTNSLSDLEKKTEQASQALCDLTIHTLDKANEWLTKNTKDLDKLKYDDHLTNYEFNLKEIEKIHSGFKTQPGEQQMIDFCRHIDYDPQREIISKKIKEILENQLAFSKKIEQHSGANMAQGDRVNKRCQLVEELKNKLAAGKNRNPAKNPANNTSAVPLESQENTKPGAPLDDLSEFLVALDTYKEDGNSNQILNRIRPLRKDCTDENLALTLNKMTVLLVDSQLKLRTDELDPTELHKQALERLALLKPEQPKLYTAAEKLYEDITKIRVHADAMSDKLYGQAAIDLADELQADLDRFVYKPENKPEKEAYEEFREIFSARLLSHSEEMGVHRALWKPIVANILIGLTTLGAAFLFNYAINGHAFFFKETKRAEHMHCIEESFNKVALA